MALPELIHPLMRHHVGGVRALRDVDDDDDVAVAECDVVIDGKTENPALDRRVAQTPNPCRVPARRTALRDSGDIGRYAVTVFLDTDDDVPTAVVRHGADV